MFQRLIQDFPILHATVGLLGNAMFFAGSILFLQQFEPLKSVGVWLFIIGSACMLIGAIGDWLLKHYNYETKQLNVHGEA